MGAALRKVGFIRLSKVKDGLRNGILGHPFLCFRQLPSTNDMAKELANRGAREGTVIIAETQTRARGRLARKWLSPNGGLWLSIVLRPRTEPKHAPKLTLMVSVAVVKTLGKVYQMKTQIKWPNDVLVKGKKICGILTEAKTEDETLDFVVVGIGINANFNVDTLPTFLQDTSTTLKEVLKKDVERESLLCTLLEEIESYYHMFTNGKFSNVLKEWRDSASFLGSYVQVVSNGEKIEGKAIDIDDNGALIVELEDETMRRVMSGDLILLKIKK